ncbi:MAG: DUF59 domain-containing protein [Bacteroidales bacterium]|nr:DUF59 domain-containing protein [Bacteroidales bacterium]
MQPTKQELHDTIVATLRTIYDPEIPVNIYDLKLIRAIDIDDRFNVHIALTMTAPDCPEAEFMYRDVLQLVGGLTGVRNIDIELTFNPPWSPDDLDDDIKLELGLL